VSRPLDYYSALLLLSSTCRDFNCALEYSSRLKHFSIGKCFPTTHICFVSARRSLSRLSQISLTHNHVVYESITSVSLNPAHCCVLPCNAMQCHAMLCPLLPYPALFSFKVLRPKCMKTMMRRRKLLSKKLTTTHTPSKPRRDSDMCRDR
jgi:hypothetical protein